MRQLHAQYHHSGTQAEECAARYWEWFNKVKANGQANPPYPNPKVCDLLTPDQHLEGERKAMEWVRHHEAYVKEPHLSNDMLTHSP